MEPGPISNPRGRNVRSLVIPHFAPTLALLLLVAFVFGGTAGHEFVNFDDDVLIYANHNLVPPTTAGLANQWRSPHANLYIPMVDTAWWCIAQAALLRGPDGQYALNPWLFHLANIVVHAINVLLVWQILRRLVRGNSACWIGAAVFAVHPLQVEPVAWATGMKDLLCALFSLLTIAGALRAAKQPRHAVYWWAAATVCFIAALFSKPSAVSLPVVVALLLFLVDANRKSIAIVLCAGLMLALPVVLVTKRAQPALDVVALPLLERPLVAGDALAFYVRSVAWPSRFAIDYGRTPGAIITSGAIWWTWILPLVITVAVLCARRRVLIVAWLIMIVALAPNLGLIPFQYQIFSTVSDRYAYFAMLGLAIGIASLLERAPKLQVIGFVTILLFACDSLIQSTHWRDADALWQHTIDFNPRSGLAYGNLGVTLLDRGDAAGALPLLQRAAALDPNDAFAPMNLARAQLAVGDTTGAAQSALELERAYHERPDFDADLTAAVLERFAAEVDQRGDAASASKLRRESARLRGR